MFYGLSAVLHKVPAAKSTITRKGQQWNWGIEEQEAFERLKDLLCTDNVLAHYDPALELGISCEASVVEPLF